ncbi:hypothetical protein Hdeb2414_s0027g00693651 [Helianthus debilis subsp. tardiflorus]
MFKCLFYTCVSCLLPLICFWITHFQLDYTCVNCYMVISSFLFYTFSTHLHVIEYALCY